MKSNKSLEIVTGASVLLAILQSLCTAVVSINGIRVLIGLGALAASSIAAPLLEFHQDAIRIPMLVLAVVGSLVNLAVLAWIWRLRSRPEAKWRQKEIEPRQRRSERLQVAMALLTLILVGVEVWAHGVVHRKPPAPQISSQVDYQFRSDLVDRRHEDQNPLKSIMFQKVAVLHPVVRAVAC